MQRIQVIDQQAIDSALLAFYRFTQEQLSLPELEQAMSYEAGSALVKHGLTDFTITQMVSGRYRLRHLGLKSITGAGQTRLEQLLG